MYIIFQSQTYLDLNGCFKLYKQFLGILSSAQIFRPVVANIHSFLLPDNRTKAGGFMMNFSTYPMLSGSDAGLNIIPEPGLGNQAIVTGKHQPPWKSNSQNSLPDLLQGSTTSPTCSAGSLVSPEERFSGVSDSISALSLLSSHPCGSRSQSSRPAVNIVQSLVTPCAPMAQFSFPSWDFKSSQANDMSHETRPDLGSVQLPHPGNSQYNRELGLSQPTEHQFHELKHSWGYDSSVQHMRWSL